MVLAWSLAEIIRYTFYAFNLAGWNSGILVWIRYTAFYVLYPVGASSEASLIYATLPSSSMRGWLQAMYKLTDYVRAVLFIFWWPGMNLYWANDPILISS